MRLSKSSLWLVALASVAGGLTLFSGVACSNDSTPAAAQGPGAPPAARDGIGALGRIEPSDGIVRLAARSLSGQPSIVGKLLVAERDAVKQGQILAELDSAEQLKAMSQLAEAQEAVARQRLRQLEAGARPSDVAAQRDEIDRIDVELANARKELARQESLLQKKSGPEAAVDQARVRVDSLTRLRQQAANRLASISEVRSIDIDVARAEVEAAARGVARTRAEYNASLVRSPIDGRVLKVHARPGEQVGSAGLMELANTDRMYVLAEVSEGDMARVRPGQRARISGHGLPTTLTGVVERVGLQVTQNSILKLNPAEFSDARVVETKIRLDEGVRVADLIHLRVNVFIEAQPPSKTPSGR